MAVSTHQENLKRAVGVRMLASDPVTGVRTDDRPPDLHAGRPAETLYELLAVQAQRDPDAVAILALGRTPLTFGGLLDQIDNLRTVLNGCGLGRGDRIAHVGGRGPETAVALLGIASCAVCVPLNSSTPPTEMEKALEETKAKALLVPATTSVEMKSLARQLGIVLLEYSAEDGAPAGRLNIDGRRAAAVTHGGPAAAGDLAYVLRTSGTTSRSKIVPISHRNVVARTAKSRRIFDLRPGDRCLNLMPLCYHHGLNSGLMLPLVAGSAVICPQAFNVDTFFACMREFSPTWYTASFTYHQTILEWLQQRPNALDGHRIRFMRAGSGPLAAHIRTGVEEMVGAPLLEVYGTTETGTVAANSPVGKRKPGTVGASPDNDLAIMDDDGNLLATGAEGEVVVRGPIVFDGYENDPAANRRAFRGEWYRTGDHGVIDEGGFIKLLGRRDEVINRGGEKIAPREVDDALLAHSAVAEAVSFPVPHATLHQEIAAAVVLRDDAHVTGQELRRFLATRLASFKVPRVILCTAELPKGPTGKLSRKGLAAHFDLVPSAPPNIHGEARTETQRTLLALWRAALKRSDIGLDDDFFLLGGDSLCAVDLLHTIEQHLQYQLPLNFLMEAPTVRQMEERLGTATLGAINNTLQIHTTGTQRPLFAVPGRPGHCFRLFSVLRALGPDQPCYGLQPPEMDWSSVGCATLPEMAAHYLGEVKARQPHGPYRLLGDSFGGLIAFEMALQLQSVGETVEFLGLLDSNPPNWPPPGSDDIAERELADTPALDNWIAAVNLRVSEAHMRARRSYTLDSGLERNRFRGELTYFYCTGNPIVAGHDCRRSWQQFVQGQFRLLALPGPHGACDHEPTRSALRGLLHACLSGEPPGGSDPAIVFDRTYRIEKHTERESIVSSIGEVYGIERDDTLGYIDTFIADDGKMIQVVGWAVEHGPRPAQIIVAFLGDRFLGYGASGISRPDVVKRLSADAAQYSGFHFIFRHPESAAIVEQPRLFVLSGNGRAAELLSGTEQDAVKLRAKLAEYEAAMNELRRRLDAMENSTSWRITSPLRFARRLAQRFLDR